MYFLSITFAAIVAAACTAACGSVDRAEENIAAISTEGNAVTSKAASEPTRTGYVLRYQDVETAGERGASVIEISPENHVRFSEARGEEGLLLRDGVAYILMNRWGSRSAVRLDVMQSVMRACLERNRQTREEISPHASARLDVVDNGERSVNGFSGRSFSFSLGGETYPVGIVVSADPRLAPVQRQVSAAFAARHQLGNFIVLPVSADLIRVPVDILSRGTPIKVGEDELVSVTAVETPASHFDLPGPVLSRSEATELARRDSRICN